MVNGNLLIFIEKQHKMSGKTNRQLLNIDRKDMRRACRFFLDNLPDANTNVLTTKQEV